MIVFRLGREKYKNDLSGKGAEISGGRWNSKGIAMLYTGQNIALCTTEIAVHTPLGIVPKDYHLVEIEFPDSIKIQTINPKDLPSDWKDFPHPHFLQEIGNRFISENKYLVMRVPSAVVQGEFNYLFNPSHKFFSLVTIKKTEPYGFDKRIFLR